MSDFMATIGNVAEVYDGPHATPKKTEQGPYFLSISSLENGGLDLSKSAHLSEEDLVKWTKRVTPQEGDVLFSYETRLGEAALMLPRIKACLGRRMGLLRPKKEKVMPEYLLYAYLAPDFQETIRSKTIHGATVDRIALKELPGFPVRIPSIDEQKEVVKVLRALDSKMELNRQINQTLEHIAQAIFKSWFVDFEPVKAKIQAKQNGQDPERAAMCAISGKTDAELDAFLEVSTPEQRQQLTATAALFPDELGDSEVGPFPKGWEVNRLGDIVSELRRGISPKYLEDGGVLVVNQKCIRNHTVDFALSRRNDPEKRKIVGRELQVGDVLINSTGVGTLGRLAPVRYLPETTVVDSHVTVVRGNKDRVVPAFLSEYLLSKEVLIENSGVGR